MNTIIDSRFIRNAIHSFEGWIKKNGYSSYDQYAFWGTTYGKLAKRIYYKKHVLGIPLVIPIFFIELAYPSLRTFVTKKKRFPIADAHLALGFANLFTITGDALYLDEAIRISDELLRTSIPGYSGYCWGYPFDWQTNRGLWKSGTPLITTTPYCFEAFLTLYDITKKQKYLDIAYSISQFALKDLNETLLSDSIAACSYSPVDSSMVVNASAYRAYLLMESYHRFGDSVYKEKAIKNINFIIKNQQHDGSWLYAIHNPRDVFIDHFHTCFVLKNLYKANQYVKSEEVRRAINKGYIYYRVNLFTTDGVPKPFARVGRIQSVKVEMYDYAEAINLGVLLRHEFPDAFSLSVKLSKDVCNKYQLPEGYFVTRVNKGGICNKIPYLRWPQAQMFYALTCLLKEMNKAKKLPLDAEKYLPVLPVQVGRQIGTDVSTV